MAFVFRSERNLEYQKDLNQEQAKNNDNTSKKQNFDIILNLQKDDKAKQINKEKLNKSSNSNFITIKKSPFSSNTERSSLIKKEKIPGPGAYNINKLYFDHKRQFSSRESFNDSYGYEYINLPSIRIKSPGNNNPGPGQYNKTDLNFYKPKQPSIKIGKYKRFVSSFELSNTPGPGKYNLSNSLILLKKVEPSWKIGTAKRRPLIEIDKYVPGPSKYNVIKKTKESPKYTIGLKFKIKKDEDTPGVGRYNIDNGYTLQHSPSWKIGTEKKLKNLKYYKDTPGPGAYHIPCSFEELNTYTRRTGKFNEEFRYI